MTVTLNQIYINNVNRTGTENSEALVSNRGLVSKPVDLCRQSDATSPKQNRQYCTTTRKENRKWSKEENMFIMECYLLSNPSRLGHRKGMLKLWNSKPNCFS